MHRSSFRSATLLAVAIVFVGAIRTSAAPTVVTNFGDGGWTNGDTRDAAGTNVAPAGRLDLGSTPPVAAPSGNYVLRLATDTASSKSTIHQTTLSLGSIANFSGTYTWYKENAGAPAPAFKLGIDTTDPNPASARPGEAAFDKILIYEPYDNPDSNEPGTGLWVTQTWNLNSGTWWLVNRYPTNAQINPPYSNMTLQSWLNDGTYGTLLSGGDIVAVQVGQGSGNANLTCYVDTVGYTYGASPTTVSYVFGNPVPEPASLSVLALGALMLVRRSRR